MLNWIADNISTIIGSIIIIAVLTAIFYTGIRRRRKGVCGGACGHCGQNMCGQRTQTKKPSQDDLINISQR